MKTLFENFFSEIRFFYASKRNLSTKIIFMYLIVCPGARGLKSGESVIQFWRRSSDRFFAVWRILKSAPSVYSRSTFRRLCASDRRAQCQGRILRQPDSQPRRAVLPCARLRGALNRHATHPFPLQPLSNFRCIRLRK